MTKIKKLIAVALLGLALGVGAPAVLANDGPQESPGRTDGPQESPGKTDGPQESPGLAGATEAVSQAIADIIAYLATHPVA